MLKNIFVNALKPNYRRIMLNKLVRRVLNRNPEATKWVQSKVDISIEKYCSSLNQNIWRETQIYCSEINNSANKVLAKIPYHLGGGGAQDLLYFLTRNFKPFNAIETGVAAGWSSQAILKAMNENNYGNLYSSDFPYFRLQNPEQYIGILVDENLKNRWQLDIRGDSIAVPNFLQKIGDQTIDLLHYDSDKSYIGRQYILKILENKFSPHGICIMDDIQDNFFFKDWVEQKNLKFKIFEYSGKYIGLVNNIGLQLQNI